MTTRNHHSLDPDAVRLAAEERDAMRAEMRAFVRAHPPRVRVPFFARHGFRVAFSVAGLVLVAGAGTTYAAMRALPHEALYPLKVDVIEPAVVSLAFTPSQKAQVNSMLVAWRLEEAEELITRDAFDAEAATDLEERIGRHAGAAREAIREATEDGDVHAALSIGSDLEATIDGHLEAIAQLADEEAVAGVAGFTDSVSDHGDDVETLNDASEDLLPAQPAEENADFADESRESAAEAIAALSDRLADGDVADEDVFRRGTELLMWARDSFRHGTALLEAGDAGDAAARFQAAAQAATQGGILLKSNADAETED